ncbi:PIN domain-containing protein [Terracidiphilus sp.]|jgi:uncharacterized protein|uniref:PIN domain-containing protein n=1 Tax=Terracidiphilus sp. TaxID=1964191 RepID=UPI003C16AE67
MRYLLDVNALIALGIKDHAHHDRVSDWLLAQSGAAFLTCSITELGFIRIVAQVSGYNTDVEEAQLTLATLKAGSTLQFEFIADNNDSSRLPAWVKMPSQTTDGHLLELAKTSGAVLATLDAQIPGAFMIP